MPFNFRDIDGLSPAARIDPLQRDLGPSDPKVYRYIPFEVANTSEVPEEHDYITGLVTRLYRSNTAVYQGEIREITFYAAATQDPNTGAVSYSDPVVRENFVYYRDGVGFARQRSQTITWIREDGTDHPDVKTRHKMYDGYETIVEGRRRRGHLADRMATELSGWLAATQTQHASVQDRLQMGRDFLRHHKTSFDLFSDVADHQIVLDVRADQEAGHTWLDSTWDGTQTVREWMDDQINIWGIP